MSSCNQNDNPAGNPSNKTDIPDDAKATPNPILDPSTLNTTIPNFNWNYGYENGELVIRLDLTGVKDPYTNDWVELYGMNSAKQNIWVSVDGIPKGFTIEKVDNQDKGIVDLVFLVDNSGTMDEEADAIANNIISWANKLSENLTINFGCVGYDGAITGAINITTADKLSEFLKYSTGTNRTRHFGGPDASDLKSKIGPYQTARDYYQEECGVAALRFADENFNFRPGANRIYVNFTDEENQPRGNTNFSTEWVKNQENWPATKGTIHTIYSNDNIYTNWVNGKRDNDLFIHRINQYEHPWKLSEYTGGDYRFYPSSFAGVTLDDLPVTGAMLNSYIIRFRNVPLDGKAHEVWLTVQSTSPNGEILADKKAQIIFQ